MQRINATVSVNATLSNTTVSNSTVVPFPELLTPNYSFSDFLIGLALVLGASVLNALGLNLTKRDHVEAAKLPRSRRGRFRFWAVVGMGLYILSQLVGSSLALQYLRAAWIAPLSSTSLIANLFIARWLVGTQITKLDIQGTAVVIVGVVGTVLFSNFKSADSVDNEVSLDLASLKRLWARGGWISYFVVLEVASVLLLWVASIMADVLKEREELEQEPPEEVERIMQQRRRAREVTTLWTRFLALYRSIRNLVKSRIELFMQRRGDITVRKWSAFLWSVSGGALSGQTLVYAKEILKLLSNGEASQFASLLPLFVIILLAATAVSQIICLNAGLAAYDSTLVVPTFFAVYAGSSFLTSLVALDMGSAYSTVILVMISLSLLVLTAGVVILSSKKPEGAKPVMIDRLEEGGDDAIELDAKRQSRQDGLLRGETVWGVGEGSIDEEEEEDVKETEYAVDGEPR